MKYTEDDVESYLTSYDDFEFTDASLSGLSATERLQSRYLWADGLGWLCWT